MTDNTERYMIDDAGTLIDKKTCTCYDYLEEILPILNQQENRIKALQNLQTFKKILEYAEKSMEERADWQAQRYNRLNDYYIIDEYTGQKLDQKRTIQRLNRYETVLRKETEKTQ